LPGFAVYAETVKVNFVLKKGEDRESAITARVGGKVHHRHARAGVGRSQGSTLNLSS